LVFSFSLFLTPAFASQTTTIKKWYLSDKLDRFDFLDILDKDFTDLGMKEWEGEWYYVLRIDLEVMEIDPPSATGEVFELTNLTFKEKIKECYILDWDNNCLQEMIDWYLPDKNYSVSELKEDFKDFMNGIKKLALTDKVDIRMIEINKQDLRVSFYVGIRGGWLDNQEFRIGRTSQTYTSGTITVEFVELLPEPENIQANLVAGGTLAEDTNYVVCVYSVWSTPDLRLTNFTRVMDWTNITTNSTHKTINTTWSNNISDTNTTQYFTSFKAYSATTGVYYACGNAGPNCVIDEDGGVWGTNSYYSTSGHVYGFGNCSANDCWYFKNTTNTVALVTAYTGAYVHGTRGGPLGYPTFRVWGSGQAGYEDIWNASEEMGWGYVDKSIDQYRIDGNFQCGSQYGTCNFVTESEQIQVLQYFLIYNGTYRSGNRLAGTDAVFFGSHLLMSVLPTYTTYWYYGVGAVRINESATANFYASSIGNNQTDYGNFPTYYNAWDLQVYGTFLGIEFNMDWFQANTVGVDSDYTCRHCYMSRCRFGIRLEDSPTEIYDFTARRCSNGIFAYGYSNQYLTATVEGLVISNSYAQDVYMYDTFNLTTIDTSIGTTFWWGNDMYIDEIFRFRLNLTDEDNDPIASATVWINSTNESTHCNRSSITTDANGNIDTIVERMWWYQSSLVAGATAPEETYDCNPYTITISKSDYQDLNFTHNFTEQVNWHLAMVDAIPTEKIVIYCAWHRFIDMGENKYVLCIDQEGKFKIFLYQEKGG